MRDTLFIGITRPAMVWGVSFEAVVLCFFISVIAFISLGDLRYLLLYPVLHGISYLVCLKDPRAFRLMVLWLQTKGKANSRAYWKVSTRTHLTNTRKK